MKTAFSATFVLAAANAFGQTLYWDTNGATDGSGNLGGTWDVGVTSNWSSDSTGLSATSIWADGNAAIFSAGTDGIGAWTVTDIDNRNVTLVRGGETRILKLVHARPAAPAPAPVAGAPAGGAANTPAPAPAPTAAGQRLTGDDFVRDRTARRNAARARAGLPPLP